MRLFVSLCLPAESLTPLASVQQRLPAGRAVPEENLHLTLVFLGEGPDREAERAHEALDGLTAPHVSLSLSGPALFGSRRSRALGLEAQGGQALTSLQVRVVSRLRGVGLNFERRRFRPHVTLARLSGNADASGGLAALAGVRLGPWCCDRIALMASTLTPTGALYEALAVYPLAGFPLADPNATEWA